MFQPSSPFLSCAEAWGSNQFSEKLRSVLPTLTSGRPRKDNPERLTVLYGVGLKKKVPLLERTF